MSKSRELPSRRIEVDEIWAYVGKKQRHMTPLDDSRRLGDQCTFVALDPESKLVPAYRVGKRDLPTATAFIADLSDRLANRVQLSSDALAAYIAATERAFGADIDYGQVVKFYEAEPVGRGRYSPPHVVGAERSVIAGPVGRNAHCTAFLISVPRLCADDRAALDACAGTDGSAGAIGTRRGSPFHRYSVPRQSSNGGKHKYSGIDGGPPVAGKPSAPAMRRRPG